MQPETLDHIGLNWRRKRNLHYLDDAMMKKKEMMMMMKMMKMMKKKIVKKNLHQIEPE